MRALPLAPLFFMVLEWLLLLSPSLAFRPPKKATILVQDDGSEGTSKQPTGRYERFLQSVFESADTDKDGKMTLTETYQWVLRLYIQINRQAPINPPTMSQLERIVDVMDTDGDDSIGKEDFRALAELLWRRAGARIAANKIITVVIAPLLAEWTLQWFKQQVWLYETVVVPYVPERFAHIVTNPVLGRTILVVAFVSTLGGFIMELVNDLLDKQIERREEHEVAAHVRKWQSR